MTERIPGEIPENLKALYEARTAHDGVREALSLIESTDAKMQPQLLSDPLFQNIVISILQGLDECRIDHTTDIIGAFDKKVQPKAFIIFSGQTN